MSVLFDAVIWRTTSTGTGNAVVASAVARYRTPASASVPNNSTVSYRIDDDNGNWELGSGTYLTSGTQLQRDTVEDGSSGAGTKISLSGGAQVTFVSRTTDILNKTGDTMAGVLTLGATLQQAPIAITDAAGAVIDASLGNLFSWVAAADRTAGTTTNAVAGQKLILCFNASGGARTLTLPTATTGDFAFGSDITSLTQTASGKTDVIGCIYNTVKANRWAVVAVIKGF